MGDPNTGEIYEGVLRNEGDVPLNREQADWLKSLPARDRMAELKEMQANLRGEKPLDPPTVSGATREMPRYKCHKEVWALKIAEIHPPTGKPTIAALESILDQGKGENLEITPSGHAFGVTGAVITPAEEGYAPFVVDAEYCRRHKPEVGGYFVAYKDGYKSYSPAQAFDEGYTRL